MKQNDPIRHVMSTDVVTITPVEKFSAVKKLMKTHCVHHLPVVEGKKLVGMLSRTDILKASYSSELVKDDANNEESLDHLVSIANIMETKLSTLKENDTIKHAAEMLERNTFNSLPIINDQCELVGIMTAKDLISYLLRQY